MKAVKVICQVCENEFSISKGNYFLMGTKDWESLYIHKDCKNKLEIVNGNWSVKQGKSNG